MKWLKVTALGMAIWALGLVWLEVNLVLMSPITMGLIIGLSTAMPAYFLGRHFGWCRSQNSAGEQDMRSTRRIPVSQTQYRTTYRRHTRPTLPMYSSRSRSIHSQPTHPMPLEFSR